MAKSTKRKAEYAASIALGPNRRPCAWTSPPRVYPYISHTSQTRVAVVMSSPSGSSRGSGGHVTATQSDWRQAFLRSCSFSWQA